QFGARAGLAAGVAAALWPDLVLWSATFLRDTLGSLVVIAVWWTLTSYTTRPRQITTCLVILGLILLSTLRAYLAVAVALGVGAWLAYPLLRRQQLIRLAAVPAVVLVGAIGFGASQPQRVDEAMHQLFYRQVVTRMETLGRLYHDPPPL